MRISHSHKFVFLSNPRTASTSVRYVLDEFSDIKGVHISEISDNFPFYDHISALELKKIFDERGWDWFSYKRFCVVRNPWDRVVSLYHHKIKNVKNWDSRMSFFFNIARKLKYLAIPNFNFKKYVSMINPQKRLTTSLKNFICDENGNQLIEDILLFENLEKELTDYLGSMGIDIGTGGVPLMNGSENRKSYREYYDMETKNRVAELYGFEIDKFGYRF